MSSVPEKLTKSPFMSAVPLFFTVTTPEYSLPPSISVSAREKSVVITGYTLSVVDTSAATDTWELAEPVISDVPLS